MHLTPCKVLLPSHHARGLIRFMAPNLLLANADEYLGLGRLVLAEDGTDSHWEMQSGQVLELAAVTHWSWLSKPSSLEGNAPPADIALLDEDGYPTEYAHRLLRMWNFDDPMGWFLFAKSIWQFKDYFDIEEQANKWVLHVSTAGWSGNEGLLAAMKSHVVLWSSTWQSHERGGHYVFEIEKDAAD